MNAQRCALVMAGGTGGHIFPGLALAHVLRTAGWRTHWLGASHSMESRIVEPQGFSFEAIAFQGVRGKGILTMLKAPWRLAKALRQSYVVLRRVKPDIVIGFGGYISFPAGLMAALLRIPLVLHEQNSVAGMANRVLAPLATKVFSAFPRVLKKAQWIGNPLRPEFLQQADPAHRFAARSGPLSIVVVGGSLGASALNTVVPQALALIPVRERPIVLHQSGEKHMDALRGNYQTAGVQAELTPFIDNTAQAFAQADLIIARSGASTVTEIAAIGAAALFVPFPAAVDDHQTRNARFLVDAGAGWLMVQSDFTPKALALHIGSVSRATLLQHAQAAQRQAQTQATSVMHRACEELAA